MFSENRFGYLSSAALPLQFLKFPPQPIRILLSYLSVDTSVYCVSIIFPNHSDWIVATVRKSDVIGEKSKPHDFEPVKMAASLEKHLSKIKSPLGGEKVYKDECAYCCDTPVSLLFLKWRLCGRSVSRYFVNLSLLALDNNCVALPLARTVVVVHSVVESLSTEW